MVFSTQWELFKIKTDSSTKRHIVIAISHWKQKFHETGLFDQTNHATND